ncbi:MAG: PDZ domain-containing protein [Phycisphaerales bacterium]|nr:PDZ domain-containing protein [Phycisphaerales bacterium]
MFPGVSLGAESSATQRATQYWFGVAVENIPPAIARQLQLNQDQGLMVYSVLPDSPAQKEGIQADDILTHLNGRPLTSQNDLFKEANPVGGKERGGGPRASKLTFLRDGKSKTIDITPAPRPANMLVYGDTNRPNAVVNYVAPSGQAAQIGPGIRINLATSDPSNFTVKSIREIVSEGKSIILTQETDAAGTVRHRITVGDKHYDVDPSNLAALPEKIRPLAEQLIANGPGQVQATKKSPADASLEEKLQSLRQENERLQRQLRELAETVRGLQATTQPKNDLVPRP